MNGFYSIKHLALILIVSIASLSCSDPSSGDKHSRGHLVNVAQVVYSPMQSEQILSGTLKANKKVKIFNQEEGLIIDLPVYQGDTVEKGQLLIQLDSALIQAEHNKAIIAHRQATLDFKRLKKLQKRRLTTEEALSRAQTAVELTKAEETVLAIRLQYTQIKAPFSGVISQRMKETGDVVSKFSHIVSLADISQLKVEVNLSERLINNIIIGTTLNVLLYPQGDSKQAQPYPSTITRIFPTIDEATRQGTIELTLNTLPPLKESGLKPGQLCRVVFKRQANARLHIPLTAIKHNFNGSYVYKIIKGQAIETKVTTGMQLGSASEIISGLKVNDQVVIQGFLGLKNKKKVAVENAIEIATDKKENKSPQEK